MGRGGSHRFLEQWHHRSAVLPDGDVLSWLVLDTPPPARVECPRTDRLGPLHLGAAMRLLGELGHPDAALDARTEPLLGGGPVH